MPEHHKTTRYTRRVLAPSSGADDTESDSDWVSFLVPATTVKGTLFDRTILENSPRHSSASNSLAERAARTVGEQVRTLWRGMPSRSTVLGRSAWITTDDIGKFVPVSETGRMKVPAPYGPVLALSLRGGLRQRKGDSTWFRSI